MIGKTLFEAQYDRLPEAIKCSYTFKEYASMPDMERNQLEETECLPDVEED